MPKILIVEDDAETRLAIALNLRHEGHEVLESGLGELALDLVLSGRPDVIILDLSLPDMSGFEVCRRVRSSGCDVPIIFLTGRAEEIDRVTGLRIGGNDYVTKPFGIRELLARVDVQLRRPNRVRSYRFGDIVIDFDKLQAARSGKPLHLTPREFEIMRYFVERRGKVVTRGQLLKDVWKQNEQARTKTVDTHIQKLRKKVEPHPKRPQFLISIYGEGYKFVG